MAVLPDNDRIKIWRAIMREWSRLGAACGFTKNQLRAAVDATDQFIDDNQTAYN